MNRKLIILDLDGTTLNSAGEITPTTEHIMHLATQHNHIVCIMTGRPYRVAKPFYQQLSLHSPIITFNGGWGLIPYRAWPGEYHITFKRQIALDLMSHQKAFGVSLMTAEDPRHFLEKRTGFIDPSFYNQTLGFFPSHLSPAQHLDQKHLTFDPICVAIKARPQCLPRINQYLQKHYPGAVRSAPWGAYGIMEIAAHNVNKITGIKKVARYYHIAKSDIIAFGDQTNDCKMLQYVGQGVAIKNALPQVKNVADDVTVFDHNHNGVAHYLKNKLNL